MLLSSGLHAVFLCSPRLGEWLDAGRTSSPRLEITVKRTDRQERKTSGIISESGEEKFPVGAAADLLKPIPLDSDDPRYQDYFMLIRGLIARKWSYPEDARNRKDMGAVLLEFTLSRSGTLKDVSVAESSGNSLLDQAAAEAVMRASPYPPMPDHIDREPFVISAMFIYGG